MREIELGQQEQHKCVNMYCTHTDTYTLTKREREQKEGRKKNKEKQCKWQTNKDSYSSEEAG